MGRDYKHRADLPKNAHKNAPQRQSAPQVKNRRVKIKPKIYKNPSLQTIGSIVMLVSFVGLLYSLSDSESPQAPPSNTQLSPNSAQAENPQHSRSTPIKIQYPLLHPPVQKNSSKEIVQQPSKATPKTQALETPKKVAKKEQVIVEEEPKATYEFYTSLPTAEFIIPDHKIKIYKRAERIGKTKKGAKYTIQVASYRTQAEANKLKIRLLLMGLSPIIEPANVKGSTWFRVKMGPYNTIRTADNIITQLHKNKLDAVIYGH